MKNYIKIILCLFLVSIFLLSSNTIAINATKSNSETKEITTKTAINNKQINNISNQSNPDIDPLVDLKVTVKIKEIRALSNIDPFSEPDFYVVVYINGIKQVSPIWYNQRYVQCNWSTEAVDVPDDIQLVNIKIELWDKDFIIDKKCDISNNLNAKYLDKKDLDLFYNLSTGHWTGDDYNHPDRFIDLSGYGRANGYDDYSYNQKHRDCEIWFDITQNDYDKDGIPYWTEINVFKTNPKIDDRGSDNDNDGVPIEWEYKWGYVYIKYYKHFWSWWIYNPNIWEDHANFDSDEDGLQNTEEYLTYQWGSDPHRQDIFLEIDQMEISEDKRGAFVPLRSYDLLRDAFSKRNIVFHIDDGRLGGGQKNIPFDPTIEDYELQEIYFKYFLNNDPNNWRRGVFHYSIVVYHLDSRAPGFLFSSNVSGIKLTDCFSLGTYVTETGPLHRAPIWYNILRRRTFNLEEQRAIVYAGVMMHETGHCLGIFSWNTPGCDTTEPIKYINYRSCMNYRYAYYLVDYSDGSHGINDADDWDRIDLTRFQIEFN